MSVLIETDAKTDGSRFEELSSVEIVSAEIKTPSFRFDAGHFKVKIRDRGLEHVVGHGFLAFDHGALLFKAHVDTRHAGKLCERLGYGA